jgi:hypothetical protein
VCKILRRKNEEKLEIRKVKLESTEQKNQVHKQSCALQLRRTQNSRKESAIREAALRE